MKEYILKRLLYMTLTLFGIMVITFCVTRLAPGDPASLKLQSIGQSGPGDQQLSKQLIEETRRLYGFDRPLLFNLRNENIKTNTKKLIKSLQAEDEYTRNEAQTTLVSLGNVTLPYLISLINNKEYVNYKDNIIKIVVQTNNIKLDDNLNIDQKTNRIEQFYDANKKYHDKSFIEENIKNFITKNNYESARENLLNSNTASLPYLLDNAFDMEPEKSEDLFNLCARISKKTFIIEKDENLKSKKTVIKRWKKWWNGNSHYYTIFSPFDSIIRIFTTTQFAQWMSMVTKLDFGESYSHHVPVIELIKERLPISMQLSLISIFITYIIAIPLGVFSAVHQYKLSDKIVTVALFILYSLPSFWVANMLILFTTGGDFPNIFPTRFLHSPGAENFTFFKWLLDWIWHLILPITCLTYGSFAYVSRQMRVGMLDIIRQDFIRTARAKGLSERTVIFKHALRNALIPTVTLLAFLLPALLGGSIIIEEIFTIEGMGKLSFEAILNRDYPIINAIAFFSAFLTLLGMLCTDIAYVLVDPRISFGHE